MSETLTRPPKRIFVIGPMARDVMDSDGIPPAAHIPNIVEATRLVLQKLEHLFIAPRQRSYYNPITRHFSGVDLVNVAAATGIATANFYNFTKWVLREGGVFRRNPELEDIVLIRPRRILDVDRVIGMLQREFKQPRQHPDGTPVLDRDGNPRGSLGRGVLKRPTGLARDPASGEIYVADAVLGLRMFDSPAPGES